MLEALPYHQFYHWGLLSSTISSLAVCYWRFKLPAQHGGHTTVTRDGFRLFIFLYIPFHEQYTTHFLGASALFGVCASSTRNNSPSGRVGVSSPQAFTSHPICTANSIINSQVVTVSSDILDILLDTLVIKPDFLHYGHSPLHESSLWLLASQTSVANVSAPVYPIN